jgi:outer membrane protein assembly factor BamB
MKPMTEPVQRPTRKRHWARFSLASLLVAILVAAVLFQQFQDVLRDYFRNRGLIVPTGFDLASGKNVLWSSPLGSQTWGRPVISGGKVFVGTNNASGYIERYPANVDLGVLLCFDAGDGTLLWQASSEKLPTGRVHDWPLQGVTSTASVEADRLWYVTNRCEVVCLDTEGFHDDQDDGLVDEFPQHTDPALEADTVWRYDMMARLNVSPHNASCCTVALSRDTVFVVTGNAVDESHVKIPIPRAPSFIALDKATGKLLWSDDSPGGNVLHGQWGSPSYAVIGGVPQVLFPGGDGWLYSFDPRGAGDGKSKLLWKFDCNPKDSQWILGGRGTRNNLLAAPTVAGGRVYIAVGQDPEHGEGSGRVWCIDPNRRGDVSPQLVFHRSDASTPIPHRRIIACDQTQGEYMQQNPNSAAIWEYTGTDLDRDGEQVFEEQMHRTVSRVAVKGDLAFVTDLSGLVHCLDAKTGRAHWTHDLFAHCWSTPMISANHVFVTDEDGVVSVFALSADRSTALPSGNPVATTLLSDATYVTPAIADNVLYIVTKQRLIAISDQRNQ